jgi:DNA-binding PadR family transcriptional regulator
MATERLTPFSYAVLALVGRGGAGPHDIVRMMRQGRPYWSTSPSHYYAEPKRLEELGYLTSEKTPGKTRERTHYSLTRKGEQALEAWLREPTPFPRVQSEGPVRLMAGDFADDAALVASIAAMRDEIAELEADLDEGERIAETLPQRERYLKLVHRLGRRQLAAYRDWVDEVERELSGPEG